MRAYSNPVYNGYFADPCVWKFGGEYYAVGTGPGDAGGVFPLLHSEDFVHWRDAGRVLRRGDPAHGDAYWAPEVVHADGRFHLYYSVGHGDWLHQLRIAVSDHPAGGYEDIGGPPLIDLEACPFAIDPHPFRDDDGKWYLFYACDFLDTGEHCRAGTALMVDRLLGMTKLAGEPRMVLRARSDWQRFAAERLMYGRTFDWHTLEGPWVLKHGGRYFCLYSGGRWEGEGYGVDYGVAGSVLGPYSDAGNEAGPRVLRNVPGELIGPGHCSVVEGPDGSGEYIAYHAWDKSMRKRQFCLDRLTWTGEGPRCVQRAPRREDPATSP